MKQWFDLLLEVGRQALVEWQDALDDFWNDLVSAWTQNDFFQITFRFPFFLPPVALITAITDAFLAFSNRLSILPAVMLVRAWAQLIPVPLKLRQKVMTLDAVVRLVVAYTAEYGIRAISTPPPAWIVIAARVKVAVTWINVIVNFTPLRVLRALITVVITAAINLLQFAFGVFAAIILLLMLARLAEVLQDEEETAAFLSLALSQDSKRLRRGKTRITRQRFNERPGPDTEDVPQFL